MNKIANNLLLVALAFIFSLFFGIPDTSFAKSGSKAKVQKRISKKRVIASYKSKRLKKRAVAAFKAKKSNKKSVKKKSVKVKRTPVVFNHYTWQMTPKSLKVKYILTLRKALMAMQKDFLKRRKRDYRAEIGVDSSSFDELVSLLFQEVAAAPAVGDRCLYAGWPSTYQQYPGWSRPYCVPSNGSGEGVGPDDKPYNGGKCAEGQILCNPALFGWGKNGEGYCTSRGSGAFNNCQNQYYRDKGYPASAIAQQLADDPLGYKAVADMRTFYDEFCETARQSRQCRAIKKRLDKLDSEWTRLELPKNLGTPTTDDDDRDEGGPEEKDCEEDPDCDSELPPGDGLAAVTDAETKVTSASELCAARPFDKTPGASGTGNTRAKGIGSCFQCMFDIEMHANAAEGDRNTDKARVSTRYLDLVSVASKACISVEGMQNSQTLVQAEIVNKLGACTEADYSFSQMDTATFDVHMDQVSKYVSRGEGGETMFARVYGLTEAEFKSAFCAEDNLGVKSGDQIIEAIKATSRTSDYGLSGLNHRDQLVKCLESARTREANRPNKCNLTVSGNDQMSLIDKLSSGLDNNMPGVINLGARSGGTCAHMITKKEGDGGGTDFFGFVPDGTPITSMYTLGRPARDGRPALEEGLHISRVVEGRDPRYMAVPELGSGNPAGATISCNGAAFTAAPAATTERTEN